MYALIAAWINYAFNNQCKRFDKFDNSSIQAYISAMKVVNQYYKLRMIAYRTSELVMGYCFHCFNNFFFFITHYLKTKCLQVILNHSMVVKDRAIGDHAEPLGVLLIFMGLTFLATNK